MGKNRYAILILAAGSSERLGRPKQLIKINGTTLLNHTIEQALKSENTDVYVTLGGNQSEIRPSISVEIPILINHNWKEGMGATISTCLNQIEIENYDGIILSVCDQPYISAIVFNELIAVFEGGIASIIISKYKVSSGPPTLFDRRHYKTLLSLKGDKGAKDIVKNNLNEVSYISFPNGEFDIDTEADLKYL